MQLKVHSEAVEEIVLLVSARASVILLTSTKKRRGVKPTELWDATRAAKGE